MKRSFRSASISVAMTLVLSMFAALSIGCGLDGNGPLGLETCDVFNCDGLFFGNLADDHLDDADDHDDDADDHDDDGDDDHADGADDHDGDDDGGDDHMDEIGNHDDDDHMDGMDEHNDDDDDAEEAGYRGAGS